MTDTKLEKRRAKEQKEIQKWEKELARPRGKGYIWYLLFVVTVVYLADEIASQIGNLMSSVVAQNLFAPIFGTEVAVARMGLVSSVAIIGTALAFLYKPLSDRYGRKFFLIFNTLGMGVALLVISVAHSIPVYVLGVMLINFFIPHDVQQLYLFEAIPSKNRATTYSVIKAITTLGVLLIPMLRDVLMGPDITKWRSIYGVLGMFGVAVAIIAALHIRETEPFMRRRLAYLRQSEEEREAAKNDKSGASANGGIGPAFRYCFRSKQLRYLLIGGGLIMWGVLMTMNYEPVMSQGYMTVFEAQGMSTEAARIAAVPLVTSGLLLFPVGNALLMGIQGFISDRLGRKATIAIMGASCVAFYLLFFFGTLHNWRPALVGFLCGCSIGSYWASIDTVGGIMCSESAPTNLRASVMTVQPMVAAVLTVVIGVVSAIIINIMGDAYIGPVNLIFAVPGMIVGTLLVLFKTRETKGVDMNAITGHEDL